MSGAYSLVWTAEARERLWEIEEFIAKGSADRAAAFIDNLLDHVQEMLPSNPLAGRVVPETAVPSIRELVFKGYRIIYHLNDDHITVLSVFEGHRLLRGRDVSHI